MGKPRRRTTLDLLDMALEGTPLLPSHLDELREDQQEEDLYLEYKDGKELEKRDPAKTIRQYVSGFANAAGGLLLIGIEDKTFSVTGCKAPGGGPLDQWASRCLSGFAPFLSPPPRIQVIPHPDGNVLAIATARAPRLVPVTDGGKLVHFLRLHDQTLEAPDYLISDLVIGHRQHPVLRPRLPGIAHNPGTLTMGITVENEGMSWADTVSVGIVAFAGLSPRPSALPVSPSILPFVDARKQDGQEVDAALLAHAFREQIRSEEHGLMTPPFRSAKVLGLGPFPIPGGTRPFKWRAALYVIAKGSPPSWYQLDYDFDPTSPRHSDPSKEGAVSLSLVSGGLPTVCWEPRAGAR